MQLTSIITADDRDAALRAFGEGEPVKEAAYFDGRKFEAPEELRLDRENGAHLAFGQGPHFCLGAALARAEGQIAFTQLLRRFPQITLAKPDSPPTWLPGVGRALPALPVRLHG